jgi:hypothetical protein
MGLGAPVVLGAAILSSTSLGLDLDGPLQFLLTGHQPGVSCRKGCKHCSRKSSSASLVLLQTVCSCWLMTSFLQLEDAGVNLVLCSC